MAAPSIAGAANGTSSSPRLELRAWRMLFASGDRIAVAAAIAGAAIVVLVALPLCAILNVWLDETFTLHTTGSGIGYAWHQAIAFEAQPPLYFVLEAAWRLIDPRSIAFARVPSAFAAALAVAAVVGLTYRVVPRVPPFVTALVTAFNPLVIWAACEMRVYALALLVSAVLNWTFVAGYLAARPSRRARLAYIAFAVAGLYTQYFIGALLVAHAVALLVVRRVAVRPFAIALVAVAAGFAPFIGVTIAQVKGSSSFVTRASALQVAHEVLNDAFMYVLPHENDWSGAVKIAGFAVALVLVAAIAVARPVVRDVESRGTLVQWLTGLVMLGVLLRVAGLPPAPERHIIAELPGTLVVAYMLLARMTRRRAATAGAAAGAFAIFTAASLWTQYAPPTVKHGDWQRLAAMLSSAPTAPIAVFPAELAVALRVYTQAPLTPIPIPMPFTADYVSATALHDEAQVARVLDPLRARSKRLWLIGSGVCAPQTFELVDYHCQYLQAYLAKRYRLITSVPFRGTVAQLYERTSDGTL